MTLDRTPMQLEKTNIARTTATVVKKPREILVI